jgi:hypothetical protein
MIELDANSSILSPTPLHVFCIALLPFSVFIILLLQLYKFLHALSPFQNCFEKLTYGLNCGNDKI